VVLIVIKNWLYFIVLTLAFHATAFANPELVCENIYLHKPMDAYGKLKNSKLDILKDDHGKIQFTYSNELLNQSPIKNQDNVGTCHLHAWASQLEFEAFLLHHKQITISTKYLNVMHWYNTSISALLDAAKNENWDVQLGTDIITSQQYILLYGLMPESAWTAHTDFQVGVMAKRLDTYVRNIIARTKAKMDQTNNAETKTKLFNKAQSDISKVFHGMIGDFAADFIYDGQHYTTKSFMQKYFPFASNRQVYMSVKDEPLDKNSVFETQNALVVKTNLDTIENTIKQVIDSGHNVILSYDHNINFVDNATGIMSLSFFKYPKSANPLNRHLRKKFNIATNDHGVVIVGYDLDRNTGKISRYKIKNSWGTEIGDHGYFHMYRDFLRTYVQAINFSYDAKITLPINETKPEPSQLELDLH